MKKRTRSQKTHEIDGKPFHGERSPYWEWLRDNSPFFKGEGGDALEPEQANPDLLPETEIINPSTPQLLMGEAIQHLQGRQKEVYLLTMREGKSLGDAAAVLSISKGTAQKYMERAIKFITGYCREAMAKGRV